MLEFFSEIPEQLRIWLQPLAVILGSLIAGRLLKYVIFSLLDAYNRREPILLTQSVARHLSDPSAWFFPVLVLSLLTWRPAPWKLCAGSWKPPCSSPLRGGW
jgi:hypothetical protein